MEMETQYNEWKKPVPDVITRDAVCRHQVYRFALFISDLSWQDVSLLYKDYRMRSLVEQLYRAIGSISANIAEGYSRSSLRDQNRFYEYALGSSRESRDWYYKSRYILGEDLVGKRNAILSQIIRLLLTIISRQYNTIREKRTQYSVDELPTSEE